MKTFFTSSMMIITFWGLLIMTMTTIQVSTSFQFPNIFSPPSSSSSSSLTKVDKNAMTAKTLLNELQDLINQAPKNGIDTPSSLEDDILNKCRQLEKVNPTKKPVRNFEKMNGFWKMQWTNFRPAAPSSGKLGPFVGNVYQDINLPNDMAKNILQISFPPIAGELKATVDIVNDTTVAITFVNVANKLAGMIPAGPKIQFEPGKEVRLWEHVYLDDTYRILYARRKEDTSFRGFAYVMKRADDERFETGV